MGNKLWMARYDESGYLFEKFIEQNIVAIGWNEISSLNTRLATLFLL
ncbi:hypothetical protein LL279_01115 [Zunongwangia profunda]|nr:hypothetical protein [Zunongwangia profunda]